LNLVEAIHHIGKEVPHYCYHSKLSVSGNCRMCLVETGLPLRDRATGAPVLENGKSKIGWQPKPVIACATTVSPGLHVRLDSPVVKGCREGITEFLLLNHPLDCPICDQAGECKLQEYSADYGRGFSRYSDDKNRKPKKVRLGPRVMLDNERCILCSRCIRFCREISKNPVLGFINRGSRSQLACFPGQELADNYSLNTVDVCPVGALTSTDFRFKMRVWFLKRTPGICPESSVGVNTVIWSREGKIYRITPRRNDAVNDTWMPDSGRILYKSVTAPDRLSEPARADAQEKAASLLAAGATAYVVSGHMSVEEQAIAAELVKAAPGPVWLPRHAGENDGLLLSEDRTPNTRGALLTGLVDHLPDPGLTALAEKLERGEIKTLLVFGEDITLNGIAAGVLSRSGVKIIYAGTHANATSALAEVVLPGLTVFEKDGTFVNEQFRLQKFSQAVPGPAGVPPGIETLSGLLARVRGIPVDTVATVDAVWQRLGAAPGPLHGIAFGGIPGEGILIDGSAWSHLAFSETKSLHYAPHPAPGHE
jgi:NADH-quinone oxidoreductase subunit G